MFEIGEKEQLLCCCLRLRFAAAFRQFYTMCGFSGRPASLNQASTRSLGQSTRTRPKDWTAFPQQAQDEGVRHTHPAGPAGVPGHGGAVPQAQVWRGEHGHLPQVQGQVWHFAQGWVQV